jgi:hypothetical protein
MHISVSTDRSHLVPRTAVILLLIGFALTDAGTVARCAFLINSLELGAVLLSYGLIATGLIFTVWQVNKMSDRGDALRWESEQRRRISGANGDYRTRDSGQKPVRSAPDSSSESGSLVPAGQPHEFPQRGERE